MKDKEFKLKDEREKLIYDLNKNIMECYREHIFPGGVIDMFEDLLNKQDKEFIKRVKEASEEIDCEVCEGTGRLGYKNQDICTNCGETGTIFVINLEIIKKLSGF